MKRLTERINGKLTIKKQFPTLQDTIDVLMDRLEAYEDTGLEPKDVLTATELLNIDMALKKANCALDELKEYKESEEQGLLIKLPPIADKKTLYWVWKDVIMPVECKGIDKSIVYRMITKEDRTFTKLDGSKFTYEKGDVRFFYADDFSKTVFLTKEEAEKELERLNKLEVEM